MSWKPAIATALVLMCAVAGAADAKGKRAQPIAPRTADNLPNVQSATAIVVDLKDGTVLYAKNPDEVRHIASTGKIFIALLTRARGIGLDAETEITSDDAKLSAGGARTRLSVGYSFRNADLLRAMLIASDNRAPSALGRAIGLDPDKLCAAINEFAASLGLKATKFTDPPGLRGNVSTAREMSVAFRKAMSDKWLREVMSTKSVTVHSTKPRKRAINYFNTNRSLNSGKYTVLGGKTGYTDAAGYCLVIAAEVDGRRVAMVFLGSQGKLTRYGDFNRVVGWMNDGMPNAEMAAKGGTGASDAVHTR